MFTDIMEEFSAAISRDSTKLKISPRKYESCLCFPAPLRILATSQTARNSMFGILNAFRRFFEMKSRFNE
jgi:hypothetical protein